jgi:hypothetical protein
MAKRKPTKVHERRVRSYGRSQGKTQPGRYILIVCEGAETEPNYFERLRDYFKISLVKVERHGGVPGALIEKAQQLINQRKLEGLDQYEEVWCVFDVENPNYNPTFHEAVGIADAHHYLLAISNPAFEFWYILHFERTTRPFRDGQEVKGYLEQKHIHGYSEAMPVFDLLLRYTSEAIRNSKSILENHPINDQRFPNPSTSVHLLVEELIQMSPSGREHFI